jgi:hypothetical protein
MAPSSPWKFLACALLWVTLCSELPWRRPISSWLLRSGCHWSARGSLIFPSQGLSCARHSARFLVTAPRRVLHSRACFPWPRAAARSSPCAVVLICSVSLALETQSPSPADLSPRAFLFLVSHIILTASARQTCNSIYATLPYRCRARRASFFSARSRRTPNSGY